MNFDLIESLEDNIKVIKKIVNKVKFNKNIFEYAYENNNTELQLDFIKIVLIKK